MATVQCHGCYRRIETSEIRWLRRFARVERSEDASRDIFSAMSVELVSGADPYCLKCVEEINQSPLGHI
jgi:hypothetical protein